MDIAKAIRYLYPNARTPQDYVVIDNLIDPPFIAEWHLPDPQPTAEQIAAAITASDAAQAAAATDAAALRTLVRQTATSAVGVAYGSLSAAQIKSLLWILLHKEGALNADLTVKPLAQWVKD